MKGNQTKEAGTGSQKKKGDEPPRNSEKTEPLRRGKGEPGRNAGKPKKEKKTKSDMAVQKERTKKKRRRDVSGDGGKTMSRQAPGNRRVGKGVRQEEESNQRSTCKSKQRGRRYDCNTQK